MDMEAGGPAESARLPRMAGVGWGPNPLLPPLAWRLTPAQPGAQSHFSFEGHPRPPAACLQITVNIFHLGWEVAHPGGIFLHGQLFREQKKKKKDRFMATVGGWGSEKRIFFFFFPLEGKRNKQT